MHKLYQEMIAIEKNPYYKKIKKSRLLIVSCAFCDQDLALYQKVGKGGLLRMYIDRIVELTFEFDKRLNCPSCDKHLGTRMHLQRKNKKVYKMNRSMFHTREVK